MCPIQLLTTGNPANSYLTSTMNESHYGPVIASFSLQLLQFFNDAVGVLVINLFYCYWWHALAYSKLQHIRSICDNLFDL